MSQTQPRYERSTSGFIGAMIVVVLAVLAFVGYRALNRDNEATPVATVNYATWVQSGRADHKLHVFTPVPVPNGWRATSANYLTGTEPHWHLGFLTDHGDFVGIEESLASPADQVAQYVDANATHDGSVSLHGSTWQVWRDSGGDYGLVRTLAAPGSAGSETVLVVGQGAPAQVRAFTASLRD